MKRIVSSFAAIALVGAMAGTAMAQSSTGVPSVNPGVPGTPSNGGLIAKFDNGYLDQHPEVAQQLAHDPSLVNNQQFLNSHPGLGNYLANHPHVSTDLQNHPERFMNAESRMERQQSHPFRNWRRGHGW